MVTHAQQFANETLPRAVNADPFALTRAVDSGEAVTMLAALWEQAGADLVPIARMPNTGFAVSIERNTFYTMVMVTPPAPRVAGDAALIAIIGRGDGVAKMSTVAYYVLELAFDRNGVPRFAISTHGGARWENGPLPDRTWFGATAFELYAGREPQPISGIAELPFWYWWYAFDGPDAFRLFSDAKDETDRFEAVRLAPILLLPEIADAAAIFVDAARAERLRELRPYLLTSTSLASAWQDIVHRLASSTLGSPASNTLRALPLVAEAGTEGALTQAQAYELEATLRGKLAALGIDPQQNSALAEQLIAAAGTPRKHGDSIPPPFIAEDPTGAALFLDETDLPLHMRAEYDEAFLSADSMFLSHGGVRAGYAVWCADESSAMARIVDSRWVFRTATAAMHFMRAVTPLLADGLPPVPSPHIGDATLAFGDQIAGNRRTQAIVVRLGRIVARLQATEGMYAAASREVLHAATLHPLAHKMLLRARRGLGAYWLSVAYPTNAVAALLHAKGHDAAQLLDKYPLLAHPELPGAMSTLGDEYAAAAAALANFQAQVRAHRWNTYRQAMFRLVRTLLATDMGDPRVNAATAHEIVSELRFLDSDPIWVQLDAECRTRG